MQNIPPILLRFFDSESYAEAFVKGEIRLGLLSDYRRIEGSRRDPTEGRVSLEWSGENRLFSGEKMNPHFILSTSDPDVNRKEMQKDCGTFVVAISEPEALRRRIADVWKRHQWATTFLPTIQGVVYDKDGLMEPNPPYWTPPEDYSFAQKPPSFRYQKEYRYVLECKADVIPEGHLTLTVGDCSDIMTLEGPT